MQSEPLFTWEAHEYSPHPKSRDWFWALGILSGSLFAVALLLKNFLFAVLIVIGTALILLFSVRRPSLITFHIAETGVLVGKKLHPFKELEAYHLLASAPPKLLLKPRQTFSPVISLPFYEQDRSRLNNLLGDRLEEKNIEESLPMVLIDRLF